MRKFIEFQSTPPVKGATEQFDDVQRRLTIFQSTPPVKGATATTMWVEAAKAISIHAPCEGGDRPVVVPKPDALISIHAPCEGGDNFSNIQCRKLEYFNPRPL